MESKPCHFFQQLTCQQVYLGFFYGMDNNAPYPPVSMECLRCGDQPKFMTVCLTRRPDEPSTCSNAIAAIGLGFRKRSK